MMSAMRSADRLSTAGFLLRRSAGSQSLSAPLYDMPCPAHLLLLYGTETANPEDIAKRVFWEACRRRCVPAVRLLDELSFDELTEPSPTVILFIVSTMGQGEAPLNLLSFWKQLMRKSVSPTALSGLNCAVIALGDSSYQKYNFVGKKLFKRLKQLGANLLVDLCLGDDQHDIGYWGAVDPFLDALWQQLTSRFQLPQFKFAADFLPESSFTISNADASSGHNTTAPMPTFAPLSVISNERVTPVEHFQETRFIRIASSGLHHSPGDVILVMPENSDEEVDSLLALMSLNGKQKVTVSVRAGVSNTPAVFSHSGLSGELEVREMLREKFDLHAVPKRSFFDLFWRFSTDPIEKEKLQFFSTSDGQQDLYEYCIKPKRTLIEVLSDFPDTTSRIPLRYLPDLIPAIKAREFSIASSAKRVTGEIHILVVVVKFQTRLKRLRTGFCSYFLSQRQAGDRVRATVKKGTFTIPTDKPLIMIGPGSGVAPFRSIIQERVADGVRDSILFFGCRNQGSDFYFEHDWKAMVADKFLLLFTTFSRDQIQKNYVQHRMEEQKSLIFQWIDENDAVVLIAGSSNQMPTAVRQALVNIIDQYAANGDAYVTELEKRKRLQYECWD